MSKTNAVEPPFWHRVLIPAAFKNGGTQWHLYDASGKSVCGQFALLGCGVPDDARTRMPSRAHGNRNGVCKKCESKRP